MEFRITLIFIVVMATATCTNGKIVVVGTPVIFTYSNGGGADEIQAPNGGMATKIYNMKANVNAAWYVPLDNINDLSGIATIDVYPSGQNVKLVVKGYTLARIARVRIRIFAEVETSRILQTTHRPTKTTPRISQTTPKVSHTTPGGIKTAPGVSKTTPNVDRCFNCTDIPGVYEE